MNMSHIHTILACNHPIIDGETRHTIPTCYAQMSYPSMQVANQKPGKSDMLSQHAVS